MPDTMVVKIMLAGGGDERIDAKILSYIRRATDSEAQEEPEAVSIVVIGHTRLPCKTSPIDLAGRFREHTQILSLPARDNSIVYVRGEAVLDVDDAPSTVAGATSWLVFGIAPTAQRLGVRSTRQELREAWTGAGLDPSASGI